jgi:hypothetical protein
MLLVVFYCVKPKPSSRKTVREMPHQRGRDVVGHDAPIGMEKLTHRDRVVLQQLFENLIGSWNAINSEIRNDPVDNKYLGRIIENIAAQIRNIETELDEFAREWDYE